MTANLKELEELNVIETFSRFTGWINPLVAVQKHNGDIRICLDIRRANRAILREKQSSGRNRKQEISEARNFSRLDLNMAFHQIELHPDSRLQLRMACADTSDFLASIWQQRNSS